MRAADVPRNGAAAESQWHVRDHDCEVPALCEQRAAGGIDQLGGRGRRDSQPVDHELGVPAERPVCLAQVLREVVGDPCRHVLRQARGGEHAQPDASLRIAHAGCVALASPSTASAAPCSTWKSSRSSTTSTVIRSDGPAEPASTMRESSFSTSRWIVRRSGRAPNSGSYPSFARKSTASFGELDLDPLRAQAPRQRGRAAAR